MGESFGAYTIGADEAVMAEHHLGERRLRLPWRRSWRDAANGPDWRATRASRLARIPGFPDLVGFGRREMRMTPQDVEDMVLYQIGALAAIAKSEGVRLRT